MTNATAHEALTTIKSHDFDLIIIDWQLPHINGLELWKLIKKIKVQTPKVILFTYMIDNNLKKIAINDGIIDILYKPLNYSELYNKILSIYSKEESGIEKNLITRPLTFSISFNNLKVLIVDDNEINREMEKIILAKQGAIIDTANNGKEAFDKAIKNRYDLILMDLQMPIMDGFEATKKIKEIKPDSKIVAVTADLTKNLKEVIEKAKMDGFILKPFDKKNLFKTLENILNNEKNRSKIVEEVINKKKGMERLSNDEKEYNKILRKFKKLYIDGVEKLKRLKENPDNKGLKEYIHQLKGASGNISAERVFSSTKILMDLLYKDDTSSDKFHEEFNTLIKELNLLLVEIKDSSEEISSEKNLNILSRVNAKKEINNILKYLENSNYEVIKYCSDLEKKGTTIGNEIFWNGFIEKVEEYNFQEAYKFLKDWSLSND